MMLYVFHVNTGLMMTFDMSAAIESVQTLKDTIEKSCGIPSGSQVLLISGGEILAPSAKVCRYSSGTDSNPIFMFSTYNLKEPADVPKFRDDHNFTEIIHQAIYLPATYSTVVTRAKIAHQLFEVADEETRRCERMVFDQHLQQQGWLAVVANMEDLVKEFRKRFESFYACVDVHNGKRDMYHAILACFDEDLRMLGRIPIAPGLTSAATLGSGFGALGCSTAILNAASGSGSAASSGGRYRAIESSSSLAGSDERATDDPESAAAAAAGTVARLSESSAVEQPCTLTLLQWLTARSASTPKTPSLQSVAADCARTVDMFGEPGLAQLRQQVETVIAQAKQESMREIRGVAPRFQGLDKLMANAAKLVQEQCKIATAFQHNQTRAGDLNDSSILPDLCESHASQLALLLSNHDRLSDIHRRIYMSKEEMSNNLVKRILYMTQLENRMSELDCKLLFFSQSLQRVQRHLEVVEQIHRAPVMYVQAIDEVIRRRTFAACFGRWSAELVGTWTRFYKEEMARRMEFCVRFEGHFLNVLFSGFEDVPPAFALEEPPVFDANLPMVTMNDRTTLSNIIPELTSTLPMPDLSTVVQFFAQNSNRIVISDLQVVDEGDEDSTSEAAATDDAKTDEPEQQQQQVLPPKPTDMMYHLKDGCDSETDTEEFEKLDKLTTPATSTTAPTADTEAPINRSTSTESVQVRHIETLTEVCGPDRNASAAVELEQVRGHMVALHRACVDAIAELRSRLSDLRSISQTDRSHLEQQFGTICATFRSIETTAGNDSRVKLEHMAAMHAEQVAIVERNLAAREDECIQLRNQIDDTQVMLQNTATEAADAKAHTLRVIGELNVRYAQLERRLADAEVDKLRAVREAHETMQRTHKTEVESLRSRFKLMANMERSPSDTSLEKIERSECVEAAAAVAVDFVSNTPHDQPAVVQQPRAMSAAASPSVLKQQPHSLSQSQSMVLGSGGQSPGKSSVDVFRQILLAKEQELEQMRLGQQNLHAENRSLRDAIQALTVSSAHPADDRLVRQEIAELRAELSAERARSRDMEQSMVVNASQVIATSTTTATISSGTPTTVATSQDAGTTDTMTTITTAVAVFAKPKICPRRMVCVDGCTKGDNVLVMWNPVHNQYTLLQDNPINYFLHADSYAALQLEPPPPMTSTGISGSCLYTSTSTLTSSMAASTTLETGTTTTSTPPPSLLHASPISSRTRTTSSSSTSIICGGSGADSAGASPIMSGAAKRQPLFYDSHMRQTPAVIGRLLDKEFCYARKDMNRYKVQRGQKFYRVKVGVTVPQYCDPSGKCCSKKAKQEAAEAKAKAVAAAAAGVTVTSSAGTTTTTMATTTTMTTVTNTRQSSFISSFAQTDDDLLSLQPPSIGGGAGGSPAIVHTGCDMVDLAMRTGDDGLLMAATGELDDLFVADRLPIVPVRGGNSGTSGPRISVGEEDLGNMSDGSSLYQTFDEVYELESKQPASGNQPRPVSSASSETAPVLDSN